MKQSSKRRRRLSLGATWLCLALCALLAISWLASSRWTMFFMASQFGDSIMLKSGTFSYSWTSAELRNRLSTRFNEPLAPRWEWHLSERKSPIEWWTAFYVSTATGRCAITLPLWIPFALFATSGALLFFSRARKRQPNSCLSCGYDLTGAPAASPCPECAAPRPTSFVTRALNSLASLRSACSNRFAHSSVPTHNISAQP